MSCTTTFPNPSTVKDNLTFVKGQIVATENSDISPPFITFLNNLIGCGNGTLSDCTAISNNITSCTTNINSAVQELNDEILSLETENKQLRLAYTNTSENANRSSTLFRIYKEKATLAYIQNILMILGAVYLFVNICSSLYNTETK
jgi:outer membrane murein-binding lipoprotein Lpp